MTEIAAKQEHHVSMNEIIDMTDEIEEAVEAKDQEAEWKLVADAAGRCNDWDMKTREGSTLDIVEKIGSSAQKRVAPMQAHADSVLNDEAVLADVEKAEAALVILTAAEDFIASISLVKKLPLLIWQAIDAVTVSYTHLTLPTILLV